VRFHAYAGNEPEQSLDVRSLNREIYKLKGKILELEKRHVGGSHIE
jgi:hypothetical protein